MQGEEMLHCFFTSEEIQSWRDERTPGGEHGFDALRRMTAAGRPLYLFGCGSCGQSWAHAFAHLKFTGFIDNNPALWGKTIAGLLVYRPEDVARLHPNAMILTAAMSRWITLEMFAQCRKIGLECGLFADFWSMEMAGPANPAAAEADVNLRKGYALMADDLSQETYRALARFWATRDIAETPRIFPNQYFVEAVPTRFYRSFADVGAYDGDTLRKHIECLPVGFDDYYAIEPDSDNIRRLKTVAGGRENLHLFEIAASDRRGALPWASAAGSSQAIANGAGEVKCDSLDSILSGRKVTMIKMDLEGHELLALSGASGIIAEQRPALAICVYHRYEHLWRVPTWIDALVPNGYRFYLRHHLWGFMETVCYAVPL